MNYFFELNYFTVDLPLDFSEVFNTFRITVLSSFLKTNDGYISSSLKIDQKMGACHQLSNCFDNLSRSTNTMEYNRLYLDCPGP